MKRSVEALVVIELVAVTVALAIVLTTASVAHAVSPVVKLTGSASLTRYATGGGRLASGAKFHVTTSFATDTPGAQLFTIQQAVVYFPDHAGTNGRLFPSCDAAQIQRFHGNVGRCPHGSKIGSGTVTARALQLGVTATGSVSMFNSHRGKSITFDIHTLFPADIDESIDAPIDQLHGIYGEKLTVVVPHSLQEILSGVFVGVQKLDVTLGSVVVVHGVAYSFLKARTCPTRAMHGVFGFEDWTTGQTATATTDAKVHCHA
jgi:hypothetical protein